MIKFIVFLACLVLITPTIAELTEEKLTDLAGHNIIYYHGPGFINLFDDDYYAANYGRNFVVGKMTLDLYDQVNEPLSVMWFSETEGNVTVDVLQEMYERLEASGADTENATLSTVNINGIEWHTAYAPKKDGSGTEHVAMIAYTNGQKTATITMDESRKELDLAGFNQTLRYVRFEQNPKTTPGLPLAYFFSIHS